MSGLLSWLANSATRTLSRRKKKAGDATIEGDEAESQELVAHRMGLIAPNGERKSQWDWFVLVLVLYTSIAVPLSLSFFAFNDLNNSVPGFVFDIVIDVCFIIDVVRRQHTPGADTSLFLPRRRTDRPFASAMRCVPLLCFPSPRFAPDLLLSPLSCVPAHPDRLMADHLLQPRGRPHP
jgi:hypothetical protein